MKLKFILILLTFVVGIASEEFAEYTVQKGDTLSKISQDKLSDPSKWKELLKYNKIDTPNLIRPGLVLKVPDYLSKKKPEPKVEAPKPKVLASLTLFLGDVKFKADKDKDWSPVKPKQGFVLNDLVRTQEKGKAEIIFEEEPATVINIKENTIIKIDKQKDVRAIFLQQGDIHAATTHDGKKDVKFKISTTSSVAGVRGTDFNASANEAGDSIYECKTGLVQVSAQGVTVDVPAGFGTKVENGKPPMTPFKLLAKPKTKPPHVE